jgi:hypothetical protein
MPRVPFLRAVLFLAGISAQAQIIVPGPNPPSPFLQMKAYLGLTDAQLTQITVNLNQYSQLVVQRQQRMLQVQGEIQQETAKSPLDPAALGIRYAEVETICRNVKDEAIAAQTRNLAILTDAQKEKLKVLQDAYKLLPVILEAQNAGVLAPPPQYPINQWFNTAGFAGTPVLSGCQQANTIYDPLSGRQLQ